MRVAQKRRRAEERKAAAKAAAEAAGFEYEDDPEMYDKNVVGNWFKARTKRGNDDTKPRSEVSDSHVWSDNLRQVFNHFASEFGLLTKEPYLKMLDELELDLTDDEALERFRSVDVDGCGQMSFDEFERLMSHLIKDWRARDDDPGWRIQDQYRPLISMFEENRGIFGNNSGTARKGFLRIMQRNGQDRQP